MVKHNLKQLNPPPATGTGLLCALALLSVLTGRKIKDRQGTRTNLYIVCQELVQRSRAEFRISRFWPAETEK